MSYSTGVISPIDSEETRRRRDLPVLVILIVLSAAIGLGMTWMQGRVDVHSSLFQLGNLVGATTRGMMHGEGLSVCTDSMGTVGNPICFHAGRMPMASFVVAAGMLLLGDHILPVYLFKTALFLIPLELCIYLAWRHLPRDGWRRLLTVLLLLAPFGIIAFLANVVNVQVEEGYSYSLLALAEALLFFAMGPMSGSSDGRAVLFALVVDGLYLSKSSMIAVVAVLTLSYLLLERQLRARLLVLVLVAAAPVGWALHQHHASGRYSLGTSIDGMNLHKSNNPMFLALYPPAGGETLDVYDSVLNRGLYFTDEWSFDDYHKKAAMTYLRSHPWETLEGDRRKLGVIFFSVTKLGSREAHGVVERLGTVGLVLFRLILWAALLTSGYKLFRPGARREGASDRAVALIFFGLVAATALPYVVGFAYTRHISVLIYPAVLLCCRYLEDDGQDGFNRAKIG